MDLAVALLQPIMMTIHVFVSLHAALPRWYNESC